MRERQRERERETEREKAECYGVPEYSQIRNIQIKVKAFILVEILPAYFT